MSNKFLDFFGSTFICQARDFTIADWDDYMDGVRKSAAGPQVNAMISKMSDSEKASIKLILPAIVDSVLHNTLFLLESDESIQLKVCVDGEESDPLAEISDGLAGELVSSDGWIARFSSERHFEAS